MASKLSLRLSKKTANIALEANRVAANSTAVTEGSNPGSIAPSDAGAETVSGTAVSALDVTIDASAPVSAPTVAVPQPQPASRPRPMTAAGGLAAFVDVSAEYIATIDALTAEVEQKQASLSRIEGELAEARLALTSAAGNGINSERLLERERATQSELELAQRELEAVRCELSTIQKAHRKVRLELIDDSPWQPRLKMDPAELRLLEVQMQTAGQAEPVILRLKPNGRYERIAGHRRCRAALNIGWTEIDALIVDVDDRKARQLACVSAVGSAKLKGYEWAKVFDYELNEGGLTPEQVASIYGTTTSEVSRCKLMLTLPRFFLDLLEEDPGVLSSSGAEKVRYMLRDYPDEVELIQAAVLRRRGDKKAPESSLLQWFKQQLSRKRRENVGEMTASSGPLQQLTQTFGLRDGRPMITVESRERGVEVVVNAPEIEPDAMRAAMAEFLDKFVRKYVKKNKNQ